MGEMLKYFRETPKKVLKKVGKNFGPPVCEVLDPLAYLTAVKTRLTVTVVPHYNLGIK